MTRYYFHIINGRMLTDDAGLELPDLDAAKGEALRFAGAVLKEDKPIDIWKGLLWQMRVSDIPSLVGGQTFLILTVSGTDSSGLV